MNEILICESLQNANYLLCQKLCLPVNFEWQEGEMVRSWGTVLKVMALSASSLGLELLYLYIKTNEASALTSR